MSINMKLRNEYINLLYEYCNTYDSEAISQVLLTSAAQKIEMSSIYTEMNVISRKEYEDRIGLMTAKEKKTDIDIDKMIVDIDRKIYALTVEEVKEKSDLLVEERKEYVNVFSVKKANRKDVPARISEELLVLECKITDDENMADEKNAIKRIYVQVDKKYADDLVEREWCWIKGHYVTYSNFTYFLMEPNWKIENENSQSNIDSIQIKQTEMSESDYTGEFNIDGEVVLSEPGGGKTTFLKKQILDFCIEFMKKKNELNKETLFPVLITTREIDRKDMYDDGNVSLRAIIISAMDSVFKRSKTYKRDKASELYNYLVCSSSRVALVIDGFEELTRSEGFQEGNVDSRDDGVKLLSRLENSYKDKEINVGYLIISSRYKEYGYQRLQKFVKEYGLKEKFICELKYDEVRILKFVEKWFEVFKKINPLIVPTKEKERFKHIYQENPSIKNIINTPIELTSLIMLYITSYSLPTDISILYRNVIEVWLTFNVISSDFKQFSLEDILMELSRIALFMACSEEEKIRVSKNSLMKVLNDTKQNFEKYYRNNEYCKESVDKIINYIVRRNIMEENDGMYQFKHRQYQAYLCAYCIIRNYIVKGEDNIIQEKRQLDRMRYFSKHLDVCDDFWDQIIIFSAFMDVDLHDSIIEELIERSQNCPDNNYYVGILIQLVNSQGFWFEKSELELVYDELFKNPSRWNLFSGSDKKTEVKRMLINGRKENNTAFIRKGIERYYELEQLEESKKVQSGMADDFKEHFVNFFFYIIWRCQVEQEMISEVFKIFFRNYITTEIMSDIYIKYCEGYDENTIRLIKDIGEELVNKRNEDQSDCYLIVSFILSYKKDMHPLEVALWYFKKSDMNSKLMATNIFCIAAWLIQINRTKQYGYEISEEIKNSAIKECKKCILRGMNSESESLRGDYEAAYRDWCIAEYTLDREKKGTVSYDKEWYSDDIFNFYLLKCKEKDSAISEKTGDLLSVFEIVASYPLAKKYTYGLCEREWEEKIIVQIRNVFENSNDSKQVFYAFKLLIFAGELPEKEISSIFNELKKKMATQIKEDDLSVYVMALEEQLIKMGFFDKKENKKWWDSLNRQLELLD